jgi:hypothetical protein
VPLSATLDDGDERVASIVAEAVDFCRLMAGRLAPGALRGETTGDPAALGDLLHCAARLGCDHEDCENSEGS